MPKWGCGFNARDDDGCYCALGHSARDGLSLRHAGRLRPHVLRLTPRADSVRVLSRSLRITPWPSAIVDFADAFGNSCTRVTFDSKRSAELVVVSNLEVESLAYPVAQGSPSLSPLPWVWSGYDSLFEYRKADSSAEVVARATELSARSGHAPLAFFELLCQTLYSTIDRKSRLDGAAQTPEETLARGSGACRDLTVLFLAVCRSVGVAGRFVSGYQVQEASPDDKRHLHAWPEVFVPELRSRRDPGPNPGRLPSSPFVLAGLLRCFRTARVSRTGGGKKSRLSSICS